MPSSPYGNRFRRSLTTSSSADTAPSAGPASFVTGADVSRFQRSTVPGKADSAGSQGDAPAAPTGPVIRVARGDSVTLVPVGGK